MEKLHELRLANIYDLLVLDTPPTANALDFLDAPKKMVDAVESPVVSLFVNTYRRAGKLSLNLLGFGAAYVVRRLARFTGGGFLDDIAHLLSELSGLLGGMHDRAAQVMDLLSQEEVGFVIVTGPDPRSIDEAIVFVDRLVSSGMRPGALVVNRVHLLHRNDLGPEELTRRIAAAGEQDEPLAARLARVLLDAHGQLQRLALADAEQVERLRGRFPGCPCVQVPLFDEDVHDVAGLVKLADYLAQPREACEPPLDRP